MTDVRVLREAGIRRLIGPRQPLATVRRPSPGSAQPGDGAGRDQPRPPAASRRSATSRGPASHGSPFYSIKEAAGFCDNPRRALPVGSGLVLVFDAQTGMLRFLLLDNGYLTELRTGGGGKR